MLSCIIGTYRQLDKKLQARTTSRGGISGKQDKNSRQQYKKPRQETNKLRLINLLQIKLAPVIQIGALDNGMYSALRECCAVAVMQLTILNRTTTRYAFILIGFSCIWYQKRLKEGHQLPYVIMQEISVCIIAAVIFKDGMSRYRMTACVIYHLNTCIKNG